MIFFILKIQNLNLFKVIFIIKYIFLKEIYLSGILIIHHLF